MSLMYVYRCKFCLSMYGDGKSPTQKFCSLFCTFWYYIREPNKNGCVIWLGTMDKDGYARLYHRGRNYKAANVCLYLHGIEAGKLDVSHICEVRLCVSLEHLLPCTHQENLEYAWRHDGLLRKAQCQWQK